MKIDWDIVDEIIDDVTFYVDKHDRLTVYAEYQKPSNAVWFTEIEAEDFQSYLRMEYMLRLNKVETLDVNVVLKRIHDIANYSEELQAIEPFNRVSGNLEVGIEYFLADRLQQIVRVADGSWTVQQEKTSKFLTGSSLAQVVPEKSGKDIKELLAPYVNLSGDNLLLFLVWLIQGFTCGNHYGLMISAEPGSGKSSMTRCINRLLDPSMSETGFMPRKVEDLQTDLASRYLACYDNNSGISKEFSDVLCTAITGGTVTKRKLYTDRQTVCLRLHNTVVINGISIFPEESDLAERFLFMKLKKLKPGELISEHDLWGRFEQDKPLILGCIFDILAKASVISKKLQVSGDYRMADAFSAMVAIALAMDIDEKEFRRILEKNTTEMQKACAEKDIVVAVREYMDGPAAGKRKVSGKSSEIYAKIRDNYSGSSKDIGNSASHFSRRLNNERVALAAAGFEVDIDDTGYAGSIMTIRRRKN